MTLRLLHADEHVVAIDKPAGLLVHRTQLAAGEQEAALQQLRDQLGRTVWPVHRLDRGTSGVLLFALSAEVASQLGAKFEQGQMTKRYLALVRGWPAADRGHIDHPLARDPELPSAGQPMLEAQTDWSVLSRLTWPVVTDPRFTGTRVALLEVAPRQGRRHQIRRHLKHMAHPILGDATHGKGPLNRAVAAYLGVQRLWLHAAELTLQHPVTGTTLTLHAEPGAQWPMLPGLSSPGCGTR
ncbi:pseudouridine synthase [Roseateles sp. BYS87W]|uniref:tRNA pseudouridine synthase C n=1 Tax=Pelomonas baiyunensis TaxID=3299026 RepID=A0ABW7GUW0_9BURK